MVEAWSFISRSFSYGWSPSVKLGAKRWGKAIWGQLVSFCLNKRNPQPLAWSQSNNRTRTQYHQGPLLTHTTSSSLLHPKTTKAPKETTTNSKTTQKNKTWTSDLNHQNHHKIRHHPKPSRAKPSQPWGPRYSDWFASARTANGRSPP